MSLQRFPVTTLAAAFVLEALLSSTAAADTPHDTVTLTTHTIPEYHDLESTLEAVNKSTISAQTSGTVKAIYADVNDSVKAGARLIDIDNTQQTAALAQANANLANAEAQHEDARIALKRSQRLLKQGSVSQGQYDSAVAQAKSAAASVDAAAAAVRQAKEQLSYTRVTAPYSGIVTARMVEVGELVTPGKAMMSGLALQPLRAITDVPQRLAGQWSQQKTGANVVQVIVNDQILDTTDVTLYPFADSQHHSRQLRAELPVTPNTASLYPGMWARVRLHTGARQALLIPESAIIQRSELTAVYVLDNNTPRLRQIRLGNRHSNTGYEVLSGLNAGEQLVVDGYAAMASLSDHTAATTQHGE